MQQPCNHNPHHNHNHYKTTPTSTLTPRTTKQLGREHCRDKYGHWPKKGGNVGHLLIHGGKWLPAAKLGKHPRAWRFLLHTLPDVCTSMTSFFWALCQVELQFYFSFIIYMHPLVQSVMISPRLPVFVFLKLHNHTWAKSTSLLPSFGPSWRSLTWYETPKPSRRPTRGPFLVLPNITASVGALLTRLGSSPHFWRLGVPQHLPTCEMNSLVPNHPACLIFSKSPIRWLSQVV